MIIVRCDIASPGTSMSRKKRNYQESYYAKCGHLDNWVLRLVAIGVEALTYGINRLKSFIENCSFRNQ